MTEAQHAKAKDTLDALSDAGLASEKMGVEIADAGAITADSWSPRHSLRRRASSTGASRSRRSPTPPLCRRPRRGDGRPVDHGRRLPVSAVQKDGWHLGGERRG